MTDQDATAQQGEAPSNLFFGFKGRISRGKFFLGLAVVVILFLSLFAAASNFMDPRGGGGLFVPLAVLLLLAVPWIHSAIVIKRLRDASKPGWLYFVFAFGPFIWLLATVELFDYFWPLILIIFVALLAAPGFFPTRAPDTVPDSNPS